MFDDTGAPLQRLLDNGSTFVREASAHTDETIALLDQGKKVLTTQQGESENIRSLSRRPALAHRRAGRQRRRPREGPRRHARHGPRARRPAQGPRADAAGPARQRGERQPGRRLAPRRGRAAAGDLPAHDLRRLHRHPRRRLRPRQPAARLQPAAVHRGLQAAQRVAAAQRPRRTATIYPASCTSGPPFAMRGSNYSPGASGNPSPGRLYRSSYDPETGDRRRCRGPTGQPGTVRRSGQPVDPGR